MNLLFLPDELQLFIYYYSLNFNGLINLTRSLKHIMLICKNSRNILLSEYSLDFWYQICRYINWNCDNIIEPKFIWLCFNPKNFLTFKELNDKPIILHDRIIFSTPFKKLNIIPCFISEIIINNVNNINTFIRSNKMDTRDLFYNIKPRICNSFNKFVATYEKPKLTIYEGVLKLYELNLSLEHWDIFESYKGTPLIINQTGFHYPNYEIISKECILIDFLYKYFDNYNKFIGGLLIWNQDNMNNCNNFRIYNSDTNSITNLTCIKSSNGVAVTCQHTGISVVIEGNNIIAFTIDNKILWKRQLENKIADFNITLIGDAKHNYVINAIGYGLLILSNFYILDIYTGKIILELNDIIVKNINKKLLQLDDIITKDTGKYRYIALENDIGYQIIYERIT